MVQDLEDNMPLPRLETLNISQPQPATMRLEAMKMGDQMRRTDIAEKSYGLQEHLLKMKQLELGKQFLPSLTKEEFPKFKKWVSGLDPELGNLLPDTAPENFDEYKKQLYLGADNITKMNIEQYKQMLTDIREQQKQQFQKDLQTQKDEAAMERTQLAAGTATPVGLEKDTNRVVIKDKKGNLLYSDDRTPYNGGQLQPLTESSMIALSQQAESFGDQSDDVKEYWYQQYAADKTALPPFYYRDPKSKQEFTKGFAEWQKNKGTTGGEAVTQRESVKGYAQSLKAQQKQRGLAGSFVRNLNKQLNRVEQIAGDVSRVDVRLLDVPIRELKTRAAGSGREKAFEAYLLEISNEIGKLSTGSQASIRELSVDAQERWAKIHDPNLSLNELKIILDETRNMAEMRLESFDEEISKTISDMENVTQKSGTKKETAKETKPRFKILKVE